MAAVQGRHEDDAIEAALFARNLGHEQMGVVNRIEAPAEDAELHE